MASPRGIPPTSRWSEPRNTQRGISRTRCRRSGFGSADEPGCDSYGTARTAEGRTEPTLPPSNNPPGRLRRTGTVVRSTEEGLYRRHGHS
jgi:hypothetical protein